MQVARVKKQDALDAIKKNREQHIKDYAEARAGYYDELRTQLVAALETANESKDPNILAMYQLQKPENHVKDYDRAIAMLEMTTDTIIEFRQNEFQQYIMDEWGWKEAFAATTAMYKK